MNYTKSDILADTVRAYLAEKEGVVFSRKKAKSLIAAVAQSLVDELLTEGKALLPGFAGFVCHTKKATRRVNPRDVAVFVEIPEKTAVRLVLAATVKTSLNDLSTKNLG